MNEGYTKALGTLTRVLTLLSNRGLGIKYYEKSVYIYEMNCTYTAFYGAEAWGMRSAEKRKLNVFEIKCLRSLVGMSRIDRVRNEELE